MNTLESRKSKGKPGELEIYKSGIMTYSQRSDAKWCPEIGDILVELVSRAMTYNQICKVVGITSSTLCRWLNSGGKVYKELFAKEFEIAYKFSADIYESQALEIADNSKGDIIKATDKHGNAVLKPNMASTARSKLRIEQRVRMAAIRNREKHGKTEIQKHEGSIETSFVITHYGAGNGDVKAKEIPVDVGKNRLEE